MVNKQFLQVLIGSIDIFDTLVYSSTFKLIQLSSNQGSSPILVGVLFFFSWPRAGLTNRVPVRDSRAGAPLVPVGVQELMDMDRTDETTSESDNDSEGSLEDGVEDFEL